MDEQRETSLERFMQTRGAQMLGNSAYKVSSAIQMGLGSVLGTVGLAMLAAPLLGADPGVAGGAIGPLIAGGVNFFVGLSLRKRFVSDQVLAVQLSPEAKALLMGLHRRFYGWRSPWIWQGSPGMSIQVHPMWNGTMIGNRYANRRARRMAYWNGITPDMVPEEIEDSELIHLERVAAEYNRTIGALESGKAGSATLSKLGPRILKAADEAMAEALHQAAMLVKYPEGGAAARSRLAAQETALRELGERVESMAAGQQGLTDKVAYRSSIDDVLDELRLEQLARSELKQSEDQQNQQA